MFNVYKKKHHFRNFQVKTFVKENFAEFSFVIHGPTHRNIFCKQLEIMFLKIMFYLQGVLQWTWFTKIYSEKFRVLNDNIKKFFHKQFLPTRSYQYIFCPKNEKTPLPTEIPGYVPEVYYIYLLFPCCNGVFRNAWMANMVSTYFTRKFIYFCSYIHSIFTYYFLLRTMSACSNFKYEDVMVLVNL